MTVLSSSWWGSKAWLAHVEGLTEGKPAASACRLLLETSLGGSGGWDRVSGANLGDASLCYTGDSNQIHMQKNDRFHTAQCDHHTSARFVNMRLYDDCSININGSMTFVFLCV